MHTISFRCFFPLKILEFFHQILKRVFIPLEQLEHLCFQNFLHDIVFMLSKGSISNVCSLQTKDYHSCLWVLLSKAIKTFWNYLKVNILWHWLEIENLIRNLLRRNTFNWCGKHGNSLFSFRSRVVKCKMVTLAAATVMRETSLHDLMILGLKHHRNEFNYLLNYFGNWSKLRFCHKD